ncbi:S-adenosyl-L-methionine hydrolase [Aeromonas phage phiA014S]|uniref:S-adenosyl-L-methionine hydrolase n=1 Tax=Aeromonas phage phiA014S TaxID=3119845 RepID=A0ABZ2CLW9_9CAUD
MKHNVLSADALTKFVMIASASRGTETAASNMMRTAQAQREVMSLGRTIRALEMVTGFYAEQGQEGSYEQSLAIGLDNPNTMSALIRLFCEKYDQDCVLVWNRDTDNVWLHSSDGMTQLGQRGMVMTHHSWNTAQALGHKLADAFTVAADGSVWEVR